MKAIWNCWRSLEVE